MRLVAVHCGSLTVETDTPAGGTQLDRPGTVAAVDAADALLVVASVDAVDAAAPERVANAATAVVEDLSGTLSPDRVVLAAPPATATADAEATGDLLRRIAEAVATPADALAAGYHLAVDATARGHPFALQVRGVDATEDGAVGADGPAARSTPAADDRERLVGLGLATEAGGWTPAGAAVRESVAGLASAVAGPLDPVEVETPTLTDVDDDLAGLLAASGRDPVRAGDESMVRPWPHLGHFDALARVDPPSAVVETATVAGRAAAVGGGTAASVAERTVPAVTAGVPADDLDEATAQALRGTAAALDALGIDHETTVAVDADGTVGLADAVGRTLDSDARRTDGPSDPWALAVRVRAPGAAGPLSVGRLRVAVEADALSPALPGDAGLLCWQPLGSVETALAATAAAGAERSPPRLPDWLAPTQVRVLPVESSHRERAESAVADLRAAGVRADLDARAVPVSERLDAATAAWIPAVAVVGDRECEGDPFVVEDRRTRTRLDGGPQAVAAALSPDDPPDCPPPTVAATAAELRFMQE